MRILTREQARSLDTLAMNVHGISGETLMGNAGDKIATRVQSTLEGFHSPEIGIICGKGNNGGDGFAAGHLLHERGFNVTIYALMTKNDVIGDSLVYHDKCVGDDIPILYSTALPKILPKFDLMIDAILGIGFTGELKNELLLWTAWLNEDQITVSADIPTGVNANTGHVATGAVRANETITMGFEKLGMTLEPGKSHCGTIHEDDIGFPNIVDDLEGRKWSVIQDDDIGSILHPLKKTTHKHVQGKVLVLAGSTGMTGAAYLTSMAALRSGAGLVITFAPESLHPVYERKITEGMTVPCGDDGKGYFTLSNYDTIMEKIAWCDTMVIGPGLGSHDDTALLVEKLVQHVNKPLVIDADGLRPFYGNEALFNSIKGNFIITPHLGEFSRLTGESVENVRTDYPKAIESFISYFNGVLLAKYSPSLVAWESKGCVNSTGNPGLATAGSGDVLTGIVASFIAQGMSTEDAANLGMYIHGKAGDQLANAISQRGMIASDLLTQIGKVISDYES